MFNEKTVSKSQFKLQSLEYFRRIEQTGEKVVISEHAGLERKIIPRLEDPEACLKGLHNSVLKHEKPCEQDTEDGRCLGVTDQMVRFAPPEKSRRDRTFAH
jgi:hypothetical protein